MKKVIYAFAVLAMISCQQDKIGFVDNVELMNGYQEKTDVENKFKTKAEGLTKKRDSIAQAFQLEYQSMQSKAKRWSQKKTQEEMGLLQQKSQFLGQQMQQEEQQLQLEGQAQMDSVVQKVKTEIEAYGKANGYTYILTGGEGGSVLYGTETQDLTEEMLKILNDKYKQ